ncbi:MAG: hypothetical protein QF886_13370, partial [Planctomycetota bacterium]|nr:hypothetical protein [Planctomycetota bacterium]
MALASWLLWGGLGSFSKTKYIPTKGSLAFYVAWLALAAPVCVVLTRFSRLLLPFGSLPGLSYTITLSLALLFLPCWPIGAAFRVGTALIGREGGAAGSARIYFIESVGAFLGGGATTYLLLGNVPGFPMLAIGGAVLAGVTWLILRPRKPYLVAGTFILCLLLALFSGPIDARSRAIQFSGYSLTAQRESRYEHLAIGSVGEQNIFFQNGVVSSQFPDPGLQEEMIHWLMLAHERPAQVLALGAGAIPFVPEIFKHPSVKELDIVEPDGEAVGLLRASLPEAQQTLLDDERARWHTEDTRARVEGSEGKYDVILHTYSEPLNASINRLFTREFFLSARKALRPGGILALSIPSSANYLTPEIAYTNASVVMALKKSFSEVALVAGKRMILLASSDVLNLDPQLLKKRYRSRGIENEVIVPSNFPYYLSQSRRRAVEIRLENIRAVEVNTDMNPVSYFYTWRVWLSMFVSPSHFVGLAFAATVLCYAAGRIWRLRKSEDITPEGLLIFAIGASAMSIEVVILMTFQSLSGSLYWQLGILLGSFMAGLSAGCGLFSNRRLIPARPRRFMAAAILLFVGYSWALSAILPVAGELFEGWYLASFSALLALDGLLVGVTFPLAVAVQRQPAASLYAADLWGAALGAFVTGAFLVPMLGLARTVQYSGIFLFAFLCIGVIWILIQRREAKS